MTSVLGWEEKKCSTSSAFTWEVLFSESAEDSLAEAFGFESGTGLLAFEAELLCTAVVETGLNSL